MFQMFQVTLKNIVCDCCKESVRICVLYIRTCSLYNTQDLNISHHQFNIIPHLFGNLMEQNKKVNTPQKTSLLFR